MRLAPHIRPLLLGLPVVIGQLMIVASLANAWEFNLFRSPKAEAEATLPAARSAANRAAPGAPSGGTPRWTNARRPPQLPPIDRTPTASQAGRMPPSAANGRGALFEGYEFRLPTSMFGQKRQHTTVSPPEHSQRRVAPGRLATPAARAAAPNAGRTNIARPVPSQSNAFARQVPRRLAAPDSAVTGASFNEPAVTAQATATAAGTAPAETEAPPAAKASETAAEQLIAQAHQWSQSAETEAQYTRIIETCRRARASQANGPVADYANELAAWALNRRGQLKAEAGQIKQALLDFDDATRADTECWRAVHNRGVLLAQDGQFEEAFNEFNRTIEINPEFAKAYSNRGALFVVADDLDAAAEDYSRAIELDPNLAIAHRGRGRVCHLLGKLEDAIAHYDAAVQLAPDDAYAIASRADLLTDFGRYVDASAGYDRAIQIDPRSMHAFSGSAWLLATCPDRAVRDPKLALERARISIELSGGEDPLTFDTLAAAQANAGDFAAATNSVRQAMELAAPEERDVYRDRLTLYQQAKPYRITPVRAVTQARYEE